VTTIAESGADGVWAPSMRWLRRLVPGAGRLSPVTGKALLLWLGLGDLTWAETAQPERHRILVLHGNEARLPSVVETAAGMDAGFAGSGLPLEIFFEFLDIPRFPAAEHGARIADFLGEKYEARPPDVLLAQGPSALSFALAHRDRFAPDVPLVSGAVTEPGLAALDLPDAFFAVVSRFDVSDTLDLAIALQPASQRIVVITGSAAFDRNAEARAREDLGDTFRGRQVIYLSDRTLDGFLAEVAALEPSDIVLYLTIFADASGATFTPLDVGEALAEASAAPLYSIYSLMIGRGGVGGDVETFFSIGEETARLASAVAAGTARDRFIAKESTPIVDWRALRRWGLDEARLPPGTEVQFYEPDIWERYRLEILGVLAVIGAQGATIVGLIATERRRRETAARLAQGQVELAHLARTQQVGQLSGAISHELNQPLAAILANAEAAKLILSRDSPDLCELRDILHDIEQDNLRAAGIIAQLRRMMIRQPPVVEPLDLNELAACTVRLLHSELIKRRAGADLRAAHRPVMVRGNPAQIQQILLNLIVNAAEAMENLPPASRRIVVETGICPDGWPFLAVADSGPGLDPEAREEAFRAFVSTKRNGLGLGLSICRTIAEAHGGTLDFDPAFRQGARAVLRLPGAGDA
jgi:signal transduction histidine kinase